MAEQDKKVAAKKGTITTLKYITYYDGEDRNNLFRL